MYKFSVLISCFEGLGFWAWVVNGTTCRHEALDNQKGRDARHGHPNT